MQETRSRIAATYQRGTRSQRFMPLRVILAPGKKKRGVVVRLPISGAREASVSSLCASFSHLEREGERVVKDLLSSDKLPIFTNVMPT